jgi:hypothetical protein
MSMLTKRAVVLVLAVGLERDFPPEGKGMRR